MFMLILIIKTTDRARILNTIHDEKITIYLFDDTLFCLCSITNDYAIQLHWKTCCRQNST